MVHISQPKSTTSSLYPEIELYAFRHIAAVDGLNVTLNRAITIAHDDDFTLDNDLLADYYVQIVNVPNFADFTFDFSSQSSFNSSNIFQISAPLFSAYTGGEVNEFDNRTRSYIKTD